MYDTEELQGAIVDLFSEIQDRYERHVQGEILSTVAHIDLQNHKIRKVAPGEKKTDKFPGMPARVTSPMKAAQRRQYNIAYQRKIAGERVRARLLAGERPDLFSPGRPPTTWLAVMAELGICANKVENKLCGSGSPAVYCSLECLHSSSK